MEENREKVFQILCYFSCVELLDTMHCIRTGHKHAGWEFSTGSANHIGYTKSLAHPQTTDERINDRESSRFTDRESHWVGIRHAIRGILCRG